MNPRKTASERLIGERLIVLRVAAACIITRTGKEWFQKKSFTGAFQGIRTEPIAVTTAAQACWNINTVIHASMRVPHLVLGPHGCTIGPHGETSRTRAPHHTPGPQVPHIIPEGPKALARIRSYAQIKEGGHTFHKGALAQPIKGCLH